MSERAPADAVVLVRRARQLALHAVVGALWIGCHSPSTSVFGDGGTEANDGATPLGGEGASCRSDADCDPASYYCSGPGDPQCGGGPRVDRCSQDADCSDAGQRLICLDGCNGRICAAGCSSDRECSYDGSAICSLTTGHCEAKPCSSALDCPLDHDCNPGHTCFLKTCVVDGDCHGFCVQQSCARTLGTCRYTPQ